MNIGDSAALEVDLDAALSSVYDKVTAPTENAEINEPVDVKEPEKEVIQDTEQPDQGNEPGEPAEQPLTPHPRWSAEEKASFAALPREAQEFVLKREGAVEKTFTQKTQELAEQRKNYDSLEQVLAPRRQELAAMGGEAHVLNQLLQLNDLANRDPAGFIQWLAKDRNIDLGNFNKPAEEDFTDPAFQAQKQRIDTLEQKLTYQEQQVENARKAAVSNEIDLFRNEKDEAGNPKRPHLDAVRGEMAAFFQSGVATTLQDAYDRAIYANPAIRQQIFAEQEKARALSTLNATKEAAAKASKATGVQVKSKVPATPGKAKGGWEDTLESVVERVMGA